MLRASRLTPPAAGGIRTEAVSDREEEGPKAPQLFADEAVAFRQEDDEQILDEIPGAFAVASSEEEAFEIARDEKRGVHGLGGRLHFVRHREDMSAAAVS